MDPPIVNVWRRVACGEYTALLGQEVRGALAQPAAHVDFLTSWATIALSSYDLRALAAEDLVLPSGVQSVQATAFLSAPEASVGTQGKISSSSWAFQPHKDFNRVSGRREKRSQLHNRYSYLSQKSFPGWLVSFAPNGSSGAQKSQTAFWTW